MQVVTANNGQEAVDALKDGNFDLVLMDVEMPHMDGISATRLIRARESRHGGRTPVVAVTATPAVTSAWRPEWTATLQSP